MASVTINNLVKIFEDISVIHGVNLQIDDGEFVVLVGPSGCGKSTILRMIAGLEEISDGEILINDKIVNDVTASKRGVAMVFQTYALYPHLNVYNNMAFSLKQTKMPKQEIDKKVKAVAETLHITDYLDRLPRALSGGQRQRVAIGRAIVREPEVFLFDEPLSNLDASLRVKTRLEIARLHKSLGTTMIYVTHDQVEAMTLADKIVVLRDGKVEQIGRPIELYEQPNNLFVASFIGSPKMNFFTINDVNETKLKKMSGRNVNIDTVLGIRPEHLKICTEQQALISAKIDVIEDLGEYGLLHLITGNLHEFSVKIPDMAQQNIDDVMSFTADKKYLHFFDKQTEQRITT
ncbi:MAG: sn-glycerol-3-phosphate ABC transporter ATP-binding protein UgpC [Alphaproteobacteria bacterium]|nr:sn-glycerol-3-phosphate ABC transporter ATP-binding protein UgpC [Alphaproteobacteria bacterium]